MKPQIWIGITLIFTLLTGCGQPKSTNISEVPPETPAPSPSISPTPEETPAPVASPSPSPAPTPVTIEPSPNPVFSASPAPKPKIANQPPRLGKSIYPNPAPVKILGEPVTIAKNKAIEKPEPAKQLLPPNNIERKITPDGIGTAKVGMTLGELKQKLGSGFQFKVKNSFLNDFDAVAVVKNGTVQYHILYPSSTKLTDGDRIQHLITDNPGYRTEQGVGPGTPIGKASTVYGSPTFSFSRDDRSGEFVNFTQNPNGIAFRPKAARNRTFAGEYPESNDDYLKTDKYDPKAAIGQITVSCGDRCGEERSNVPEVPNNSDNKSIDKPTGMQLEEPDRAVAPPASAPVTAISPSASPIVPSPSVTVTPSLDLIPSSPTTTTPQPAIAPATIPNSP
jgi:hypothetical protein